MTDREKEILIPLLEKLGEERCNNCNMGNGICTDKSTDENCPFYMEPYDWCDGWDCAIGLVIRFLKK